MRACFSENPVDRPSFAQLVAIFDDLKAELATGTYINTSGNVQVRLLFLMSTCLPSVINIIIALLSLAALISRWLCTGLLVFV
jgi:hypothetical protein